jgi:hypothetical protein
MKKLLAVALFLFVAASPAAFAKTHHHHHRHHKHYKAA